MSHTKLVFIRHGHMADNDGGPKARMSGRADVPLSALGREQVARLARALADRGSRFATIYTSPLQRARDTAIALTSAGLGPPIVCDALLEIDCGVYDGMPIERVKREAPALWEANLRQADDEFCWPGGERYSAFRARCLRAVCTIARNHQGLSVALVTHAGVINQVLGALAGLRAAQWEPFRPGNAALTVVHWAEAHGTLVAFDDRSLLDDR